MYDAYVEACTSYNSTEEAKEIFTKLETGDEKENQEWKCMRDEAIKHLVETYQTLGISFDEFSCESDYKAISIKELFNTLVEKKKVAFENGQLGMHLNGQFVPLMRQNDTTLYLSRDVAAALDRYEKYRCDKILYVVDKSQSNHMDNLKEAICNISGLNIIEHVPFGRVIGMSTRKGTSIFLEDILDKVCIKMAEQQKNSLNTKTSDPDTTRILGLSALFVNILRHNRLRDFKFNWDTAIQGTGDSGIKIQYTHCRLKSLEEKFDDRVVDKCDPSLLNEDIAVELALVLFEFDDVLLRTSRDLESSYLVQYLFRVCNLCAKALTQLFVKDQPVEIGNQRLLLFRKVRETLNISLRLLGLKPLDKMLSQGALVLHLSALLETVLAALITLLLVEPFGELDLKSCPVKSLSDWYTLFHNPRPNYTELLHCTQEAVYPLHTMVFVFYGTSVLTMILLRPWLVKFFRLKTGGVTIYAALYFFPILAVFHAVFGGIIYYTFPYIVIVLSVISNAAHFAFKMDQSMTFLVINTVTDVRNLIIVLGHWIVHGYGIISLTQLGEPVLHGAFLCLVPLPALFYIVTARFTDPHKLHTD